MKHDDVIKAVEAGGYEINHEYECGCSFNWGIDRNGELLDGCDASDCWETNILRLLDGTPIVEAVRFSGTEILIKCEDHPLCLDDISQDIRDEMSMSDTVERGESGNNPSHDDRMRDELIEWLQSCGYALERDDERGFANEYTMILREPEDGETVEQTQGDAEEWADDFLYAGDAITEAFVGFSFRRANHEEGKDHEIQTNRKMDSEGVSGTHPR